MNWANQVTYIRLLLIPLVIACFYSGLPNANLLTALLFTIASLSDWVDGYLARRLNQASDFGAFLDPVADKLLVTIVLIMLVSVYSSLLLATVVIVTRELAISALREWMGLLSVALVWWLSLVYFKRKLGGVTGDCLGATQQLSEVVFYLCLGLNFGI